MKALNWLGPILDCSGYAAAARGYLRAARATGIRLRARDRSRSINLQNRGMDKNVLALYDEMSRQEVPPGCPTVQHQVPDQFFLDKHSQYRIGYTIFEMTRVPSSWARACNQMDVIWTGSEYSRSAFVQSGVRVPVKILPHAIDTSAFHPDGPSWNIENRRSIAFLSVFDFTERKAWRELLRAYWNAFSPKDDVCMILKVFYGGFDDESRRDIIRRIATYKAELGLDGPPILLYCHDIAEGDMPSLYRAADCYVGISREGFGLSFAEAMACGLACIGPEVGGMRQFMTPGNSLLVDYEGDEPVAKQMVDMFPLFDGLLWARHSWEHLSRLMRKMVEDDDLRARLATRGTNDVRRSLGLETVGRRMTDLIPG